jgi:alanine dehydrogenase
MIVGVIAEVKLDEHRVALTPAGTRELVDHGHTVLVQTSAGSGTRFTDTDYAHQGALIVSGPEVYEQAEIILAVKEPQPEQVLCLRSDHLLFTYLHLAADPQLGRALCHSGATCLAYETVEDANGRLPLLEPMSAIAGRLAVQEGASFLERPAGGRGVLLGGIPGVHAARVLVIGAGVVGRNAAAVAVGMDADVTVLDLSVPRLQQIGEFLGGRVRTLVSTRLSIETEIQNADLIIGGVLIPGSRAPHIIRRDDLKSMREGTVLVDVAIDQGGCFETSRATSHRDPVFVIDGITHYCVANMPGAVPVTSTQALTNSTLPYALALADHGLHGAIARDPGLAKGLNVYGGEIAHPVVAATVGRACVPFRATFGAR